MRTSPALAPALLALALLAGCETTVPEGALALAPESLQRRQLQTRRFETEDERTLLVAAAGLLQDTGFAIDESEVDLGVIVGSKERDATDTGQIIGTILLAGLGGTEPTWDEKQRIRASLVTRRSEASATDVLLRATFQRIVWNNHGQVSRQEPIDDPGTYQQFFEKLSKAVFLEAHDI